MTIHNPRRNFAAPAPFIGRALAEGPPDVSALTRMFEGFAAEAQANASKIVNIEASLDDVNKMIAALRVGGGTGGDLKSSRAAMTAFGTFIQTGKPDAMAALRPQAAGSTDSGPDGGFLVPPEVGETIIARQVDISPMRRLATVRPVSSDSFEQLINVGGSTAQWVGERQARPETGNPQWKALNFATHEIYANPSVSQKLLDDSAFDVAVEVTNTIAQDFDVREGSSFTDGDGVEKPRGILQYPTASTDDATRPFGTLQYVPSGVAAALTDTNNNGGDALIDLVYKLRAGYRRNATWLMNSATAGVIRKLKDAEDRYIWQPSLIIGQPPTLLGYPVEFDENMQAIGANSYPIAFGDFKAGYLIVDRTGVRILRDPFTNKPFVMFYATKRVGGGLLHSDAIKLLKIATA